MSPHCLGKATDPGRTGSDGRLFLEAVLWIARTGSPWRDLPGSFGKWNSVFTRFRYWVQLDVFKRIFDAVSDDPDMEFAMVDATIVRVHRHGQGAKGTSGQAIGKSRGGLTTKILALTDALGNLVRFVLMPGQRFDTVGVAPLIEGVEFGGLLGDKAFDSNSIITELNERGAKNRHLSTPTTRATARHRRRNLQMAPPHREFLLQTQRVQAHRHAERQNRPKLRRDDLHHLRRHQ